jgi:hypothetical protein
VFDRDGFARCSICSAALSNAHVQVHTCKGNAKVTVQVGGGQLAWPAAAAHANVSRPCGSPDAARPRTRAEHALLLAAAKALAGQELLWDYRATDDPADPLNAPCTCGGKRCLYKDLGVWGRKCTGKLMLFQKKRA